MEVAIFNFIKDNLHNSVMDVLMQAASFLGGAVLWIAIGVVLCIVSFREGFKKYRVVGITVIVAVLVSGFLCRYGLKPLFLRERPFYVHDFSIIVSTPTSSSFPSTHSAMSFAGAVVLFWGKRMWGIIALIFASIVGFSRVYLLVHYPSDILVGAIFGVAIGLIVVLVGRRFARVK